VAVSAAKLERLLNLTAALLETPRPLTAEQLRQRVPGYPEERASFRRAFERDKDDLRELGIPLRREPVLTGARTQDGYRIPPDEYYLRDPGLQPDELAALHLAARVVRLEGATEALWKLGGEAVERAEGGGGRRSRRRTSSAAAEQRSGGPAPPADDPAALALPVVDVPTDERLTALFGALVDRRTVRFTYAGPRGRADDAAGGAALERRVDPHRLDFQRGRWYLSGHDHGRDALRSFRVDRIAGPVEELGDRPFRRPERRHPGVRLQPWELGAEEVATTVVARLLVDPDQAAWAVQHVGPDNVDERRPDGSVVLRIEVANRDAFRSFVLTFLDHAEVLGPPELRADVVDWLRSVRGPAPVPTAGPGASVPAAGAVGNP
jgi:proteasome accessory factor B